MQLFTVFITKFGDKLKANGDTSNYWNLAQAWFKYVETYLLSMVRALIDFPKKIKNSKRHSLFGFCIKCFKEEAFQKF